MVTPGGASDPAAGGASRRVRVLWVTKGLEVGGIERLLCWTAGVRDQDRFDCEAAYVLSWASALDEELRATGVTVHRLGARHELDLAWALRLRRVLVSGDFDVVHFHSPYVAGVGRLVVRSLSPPRRPRVVSTEHNVWGDYRLATRTLNALTTRLDDAHVAVSEQVRRSMARSVRPGVDVVLHGVPLASLRGHRASRDDVRAELGLADGDVVIATVANLRAQKGYPELLEAARRLLDRGLPVRFVAVGQGPMAGDLARRHASLGLGDRFRFLGYRDDAVHVLAGCDVFALASRHEGGPLAVIEALAMGLPVVATAVGVVPDVVTDGVEGLLVPPRRADLLAEALGRLVVDPARRSAMAAAALRRADDLEVERTVRRLEELYRDLAASRDIRGKIRRSSEGGEPTVP